MISKSPQPCQQCVLEGGVPLSLGNLCMLNTLDLSVNKYLHGDLNELGEVFSGCMKDSLEILTWVFSELTETIPDWLGNLKNLKILNLYGNSFYGPLLQLGLHSLKKLDISRNTLNGSVPLNLGQLFPNLEFLDFAYNNLTGVLTEAHFAGLTKMEHLGLSANEFKIEFVSQWVPPLGLKVLHMWNSKLGLGFPSWIQKLKNLSIVFLPNAGISDTLPDWFWSFSKNLQLVDLSHNDIRGKLPASLEHLSNLLYVDLSENSFEGSVPQFPAKLVYLLLFSNNITGRIPETLCNLKKLVALDLSKNQLMGQIPDCRKLTSLSYLQNLNLSKNRLIGRIPQEINMLRWLESLDLSMNNLSGPIPTTMTMISFLSHLNLSYNNLSGRIPYGGQLLSLLDPSIYVGNSALCGFPIGKECQIDKVSRHQKQGYDWDVVLKDDNK